MEMNTKPAFIKGEIFETYYDGTCDDLLTGGLGKSGLASPEPPAFENPAKPSIEELRTRAIYTNYRALIDTSLGGGYGVLYGPNVSAEGDLTQSEGLIAGTEFIALADVGGGDVTMMIQIPDSFDPQRPRIIGAPSSGSRGIYGAIGTAGEAGLKRGFAVAYTDKGTGTGAHDLMRDIVISTRGQRKSAKAAVKDSNFTAPISDQRREAFNAQFPNRIAFKHAHSQQNPEQDWGRHVLQSIEFAFFVLRRMFPDHSIRRENTLVIASSVSNGGGASLRAAEQDTKGLIDGVVVSEPNVSPLFDDRFHIAQGNRAPVFAHSRSLCDYTTLLNVYQPCANLDRAIAEAPFNSTPRILGENACASLSNNGLLRSTSLEAQAAEAQRIINDFGILPEQNLLQPSHWFFYVPQSLAVTYANAYGRFSVTDNPCGYSFGATDDNGDPAALDAAEEAALFAISNGIPPTSGVNLINDASQNGPKENRVSISASAGHADQNLDGALCLRALTVGRDPATGKELTDQTLARHHRIAAGVEQIRATGDLHGVPTVIVNGRDDAILPPNFTSRAYFGRNQLIERGASNLRYYEVTNAHHLDMLNAYSGFDSRFIPLHYYFLEALDFMLAHLTKGAPLPPSQVIRTTPRGVDKNGKARNLNKENLPQIQLEPGSDARITFENNMVYIPE
jgi:hydroxybutyrate-dimer hydrolase